MLGALLGTSYSLTRLLGSGGSGEVFEGTHDALGKRVAIKILRAELAREPDLLDRLRAEARILARITHPALVAVWDLGLTADGRPFFAMEYVDGETAAALVARQGPLPISTACDIVADVLEGLAAAHALGIVHRDVKPANVIVGKDGRARIVDFGIATSLEDSVESRAVIGTPTYMAPEQILGQRVSPATDVYAAACTLFTLLTGAPPFSEDVLAKHIGEPAPLVSERTDRSIGTALDAIVAQGLAKDPEERPRSAAAMSAELRRIAHPDGETRQAPAARPTRANIRELPTKFHGRTHDLDALASLFADGARLVTLVGPGGAGKTRLAKRYAALHVQDHADAGGTWFVALENARSATDVVATIGRVLGIAPAKGADEETLVRDAGRALHAHGAMLLVLDNCEQATGDIARVLSQLLELAPDTRFLVTSRERLQLEGERPYDVEPLPKDQAVALFIERAALVRPEWTVGADAGVVEEIVRVLDGLPLAIELGAARMGIMSATALRDRLNARFDVLASTMREANPRQRTLFAAIDWSWSLLEPWERSALAQCSVFRGGFTIEAAEAVIALDPGAPPVLEVIQRLRDKSLVYAQASRDFPSEIRLDLYESIRDFAARTIDPSAAMARHASHFLRRGAEWIERLGSPEPMRRLTLEMENLRAVHERALSTCPRDALRTAEILLPFMRKRNLPLNVQLELADAALACAENEDPILVASVLYHRSYLFYWLGMGERLREDAERILSIARQTKNRMTEVQAHHCLMDFVSVEARIEHGTTAAALARGIGGELEDNVLLALATARRDAGDRDAAQAMFTDLIERADAAHHEIRATNARANLAMLLVQRGELAAAQNMLEDAIASMHGQGLSLRAVKYNLAIVRHERGDRDGAEGDYRSLIADPGTGALVVSLSKAALGVLRAERDDIDESARLFNEAEAELATAGDYATIPGIDRGHLELARARKAARDGDVAASALHRTLAERARDVPRAVAGDEVQTAKRWLDRALDPNASIDGWIVSPDGAWFRRPRGWRVDIGPRTHARRVLGALLRARLERPGSPLSVDDVLHEGWPGERVLRRAAEARVYNIIKHLRNAGLRDLIINLEGGYALDPGQRVISS